MSTKKVHIILAITFLLDFIFCISYKISFVGQFMDVLLILALFGSAFVILLSSYNSLSRLAKFYYGIYPVYLLLLVVTLVLRGGFILIFLLIPFWPFVPQKNFVESPGLQIRAWGAPLGNASYVLYKRYVLFERQVGKPLSAGESYGRKEQWKNIAIRDENKDSIDVSVNINNKDTVLTFYK